MSSNAAATEEIASIRACTVCRDVQNFDLLIEDMESVLGDAWGDLSFRDAALFLTQPDAEDLEFIAIAMDDADEGDVAQIADLIRTAGQRRVGVIVIAEEVSPMVLHKLLKLGANEFVPYPLPEGALAEAVERLRQPSAPPPSVAEPDATATVTTLRTAQEDRNGVILPVQGLAGGVGASTFAVNLANELTLLGGDTPPRVCILDLELQSGAVSTYLDLMPRDAVLEILTDTETIDADSLMQAMVAHEDRLHVFSAPSELIPLDMIGPDDVDRILSLATAQFDFVVIDMPSTVVQWTETVLNRAHAYFALLEIDMRSAQNALRFLRALKAEDLPIDKLRFVMNRAPKFTDLAGKSRLKRMAESLGVSIDVLLPDGGKPVMEAGDTGIPMAKSARKNALRKEIAKIAATAFDLNRDAAEA